MNNIGKTVHRVANDMGIKSYSLANEMKEFHRLDNYLRWKLAFKPQSQKIINAIIITGIVLALAEIVWFWLTKY